MSDTVIEIENLKKQYRLGAIGGGTLTADLQSWWARIRGKEDPNSKIGSGVHGKNETFMALDGINLKVKKGEALGIIGGNGAGKSTTLKILSRVTAPTEGTIKVKGRISSLLEVGTGFHPELTGRENIYLNGAILGMTKEEVDSKIDDIIDFSECRQFIDTPVKRYSSGMFVKLAFSVAAHLDSEILIMDEVLAVGDMKFQEKCLGKMGDLSGNNGRTILYVSHNMNTIRQLCNRCIVLEKGKIIFDGDTEDAISVYMNSTKSPVLFNTCRDIKRDYGAMKVDEKIFINSVEILDKDMPRYKKGEKLKININFDAKQDMERVCLRVPIFFADKSIVGVSMSKPVIECKKGVNNQTVEIDTSCLAPGRYIGRIAMFSVNEFGTFINHDVVDAFSFEIYTEDGDMNNITWEHRYWGHISFNDIKVY
ncbi:MAG: ABC transporter ATP-binding protein [Intestinibacter sp.]|uniref:ABC transporter ATP-binding protein n=1 Tax=Intestinibacter sp. TaxID=1965304 RepID=UPI002A82AEC9|nr:ABC transporter ATP-binding protein [Intestinibacter sp.]MDY4573599.1 ABC transporter ATP-binding protein [Intestinibacter sp.]